MDSPQKKLCVGLKAGPKFPNIKFPGFNAKLPGFNAVCLLMVGLLLIAVLILALFPAAKQETTGQTAASGVAVPLGEKEGKGEGADEGEKGKGEGRGERGADSLQTFAADIAAQSSNQKSGADIFADLRFEREKSRSRKQELFEGIAGNPESASDLKNAAQQELWRLTRLTALEDELEGILRARGYRQVIVLLQDRNATVLVGQKSLSNTEVLDIAGIISRISGIPCEGIRIYEKRPSD